MNNPCTSCEKGVTRASRAVTCDVCDKWTHIRCSGSISRAKYDSCVQNGGEIAFVCDTCCLQSLPFSGEENVDGSGGQLAGARAVPAPQVSASDSSSSSSSSCHIPPILNMKGLHLGQPTNFDFHACFQMEVAFMPEMIGNVAAGCERAGIMTEGEPCDTTGQYN